MRAPLMTFAASFAFLVALSLHAGEPKDLSRVLEAGKRPDDSRLGKARDYNTPYHPWVPPATKEAFEVERTKIRERMLVATGLWPMPPKTPLNAVVHGRVDKGDYTVEKVYFESHPGHYVTGSLYKPNPLKEKHAGVLCPHGHWKEGRFYDAGDAAAKAQIDQGAEKFNSGAHYPLQARMVQLARMGCVVFHYDMVGVADSTAIPHRAGFTDGEAALRLQNFLGLQTWNSIRALDFLTSLPEVDASRIGVTGASGGGTQTFMLCAIDPRPAAAFPAVMVSTGMQGGCICENCEYLRVGINNIAITSLFAPKPVAMSGADDWTIEIETKGLPELKQVYSLFGKPELVAAKTWKEFKHNYNQPAREMMYDWFNEHLKLGHKSPVQERDFEPIPPKELSVWDADHPKPEGFLNAAGLREYLTATADKQFKDMLPTTPAKLAEYKKVVGAAARVMLDDGVPAADGIETSLTTSDYGDGLKLTKGMIGRKGAGEQVPFLAILPPKFKGTVLLGIDAKGKRSIFKETGSPDSKTDEVLKAGIGMASADVFLTGEFVEEGKEPAYPKVQEGYPGYTFGYNRPVIANRVRDILTAVAAVKSLPGVKRVVLAGGPGGSDAWVLLARSVAGDAVSDCWVYGSDLKLTAETSIQDPNFLPGALKYGGLYGIAAAAAPAKLLIIRLDHVPADDRKPLEAAYSHSPGALTIANNADDASPEKMLKRLAE